MKQNSFPLRTIRAKHLVVLLLVVLVIGGLPLLACAFARSRPSVSVTIVNNSNWQFRHAYLSSVDGNDWGPDQLNGTEIAPGSSYTLSNIACEGAAVKVVIEDQKGCFLYKVVSCSENTTWTVTNNATPDCGS
jgi:hypothetical protein